MIKMITDDMLIHIMSFLDLARYNSLFKQQFIHQLLFVLDNINISLL